QKVESGDGDGETVVVRAGAGGAWHAFVMHTLALCRCGLGNRARRPGPVGAAPVQNIGAYGVQVGEHAHAVEAFARRENRMRRLAPAQCGCAYRDRVFTHGPARFMVTAVEFALSRRPRLRLDYAGIGGELATMGISDPRASDVAEAVIRIRRRK